MKIKEILCGVIIGSLLTSGIFVVAEEALSVTPNPFKITVNGEAKNIEGYNINGSTYFKLRDIGNEVGFSVDFKEDTIMLDTISQEKSFVGSVDNTTSDDIKVINSNGATYYSINGTLYYWWSHFSSKKMLDNTFVHIVTEKDDGGSRYYNVVLRKIGDDGIKSKDDEILLENIEYLIISDMVCISEDYFNEVILPIDKSLSE